MKLVLNSEQAAVVKQALNIYRSVWKMDLKKINEHPAFKSREFDRDFVNERWEAIEVLLKSKVVISDSRKKIIEASLAKKEALKELIGKIVAGQNELNEMEAGLLKSATELYGRIGMGQLSDVSWHPVFTERDTYGFDVEEVIYQIRQSVYDDLYGRGHSYGIRNESTVEESKIAFDIFQVIRRTLAYMRNPEGNKWNVDFDEPFQYSQQSLPELN